LPLGWVAINGGVLRERRKRRCARPAEKSITPEGDSQKKRRGKKKKINRDATLPRKTVIASEKTHVQKAAKKNEKKTSKNFQTVSGRQKKDNTPKSKGGQYQARAADAKAVGGLRWKDMEKS